MALLPVLEITGSLVMFVFHTHFLAATVRLNYVLGFHVKKNLHLSCFWQVPPLKLRNKKNLPNYEYHL